MLRYLGLVTSYRGREGRWAFMFHRISGIGVWAFVVLHVHRHLPCRRDPHAYDDLLAFYASPVGRVMEILLGAALLYHALNGMRILIIDLWPSMTVHHRQAVVGELGHLLRPRHPGRAHHPAALLEGLRGRRCWACCASLGLL